MIENDLSILKTKVLIKSQTKQYEITDKIVGYGSSALILESRDILNDEICCVKIVPKDSDDIIKQNLACEVAALRTLNHPNIVKIKDFFEDQDNFYLVEELCRGKSLLEYINERFQAFTDFSESEIQQIFRQLLSAVKYMHLKKIAHRDLKPENIIIDDSPRNKSNINDSCFVVKIIDFGFSSIGSDISNLEKFCGSIHYIAPEILNQVPYDGRKSDIWSLGVILFTLLANRLPFDNDNFDILNDLIIKGRYNIPQDISEPAENLIKKMLDINPNTRISASEALEDRFFAEIKHGVKSTSCNIMEPMEMLPGRSQAVVNSTSSLPIRRNAK